MKTGVASADFKFSNNSLFDIALLISNCKVFAVTSALCRRIFGPSSKAMAEERKRVEGKKIQKIQYLENGKSFLDEIKSISHSF